MRLLVTGFGILALLLAGPLFAADAVAVDAPVGPPIDAGSGVDPQTQRIHDSFEKAHADRQARRSKKKAARQEWVGDLAEEILPEKNLINETDTDFRGYRLQRAPSLDPNDAATRPIR